MEDYKGIYYNDTKEQKFYEGAGDIFNRMLNPGFTCHILYQIHYG